jgi:hypothetical protein
MGNIGGAMGIAKPEPMFGVSAQMLKSFGLTGQLIDTLLAWKAVSRGLTDGQRARIDASFSAPTSRMPEHSWHPVSPEVWCARNRPAGGYEVVPVRVLTRKTGDILWQQGQEFGPLSPRQYVRPGDTLLLQSPDEKQPLKFITRVLWAFDPAGRPAGQLDNVSLMPALADVRDRGEATMTQEGAGLRLTMDNARDTERWELSQLPTWSQQVDMSNRRSIGLDVTGDGSGATLVIQIPGRDYVVPIDFQGRRHIEIPNGEVSWSQGCWGWRMATKSTDYSHVSWIKMGFGYMPPRTRASVVIENLQALGEIPEKLIDPVFHAGTGTLSVKGSVASNQYLEYDGGATATVYDENWHKLNELPVLGNDWEMPNGQAPVSITTAASGLAPWLEVQFLTEGQPILVP